MIDGSVKGTLWMWQDLLLYLTVFVMAATPWLEILVVIPFGVGAGLNPIAVGVVSFIGNAIPIYLIVVGYHRFQQWWAKRRGKLLIDPGDESWQHGRRGRAMSLLRRYGIPPFALASPILTGAHLAAVVTLLLGAPRRQILGWMLASLALWSIVITIASFYSIGWLTSLW